MINDIIDPSQSWFIPDMHILDNVLLGFELVKGYGRKDISPKICVIIDLRKAYDSVEWSFVESIKVELGVPDRMVWWIMAWTTNVSYSVILNG